MMNVKIFGNFIDDEDPMNLLNYSIRSTFHTVFGIIGNNVDDDLYYFDLFAEGEIFKLSTDLFEILKSIDKSIKS